MICVRHTPHSKNRNAPNEMKMTCQFIFTHFSFFSQFLDVIQFQMKEAPPPSWFFCSVERTLTMEIKLKKEKSRINVIVLLLLRLSGRLEWQNLCWSCDVKYGSMWRDITVDNRRKPCLRVRKEKIFYSFINILVALPHDFINKISNTNAFGEKSIIFFYAKPALFWLRISVN